MAWYGIDLWDGVWLARVESTNRRVAFLGKQHRQRSMIRCSGTLSVNDQEKQGDSGINPISTILTHICSASNLVKHETTFP